MEGSELITRDIKDVKEFKSVHRTGIAALISSMGFRCHTQKKYVVTTDSKHNNWV